MNSETNSPSYELITIGGGAAGFFGSISAAEHGCDRVLILEKSAKLLGKVKISGGGRCNVTHHCFEARELSKYYPRGEKSLIGPLSRWGAQDTVDWFTERGVELKTESDGRMFPITDNSQTIIDCLMREAQRLRIEIQCSNGVDAVEPLDAEQDDGARFLVHTQKQGSLRTRSVLIASGGIRLGSSAKLPAQLGHQLEPAVPSLFTFNIKHALLDELQGISVPNGEVSIHQSKLQASGPLLITHWGLSGPGILRVSAWGARELAERDYQFDIQVNWLPGLDAAAQVKRLRNEWGKRQLSTRSPFPAISKRLWTRFLSCAGIPENQTWAQLSKHHSQELCTLLNRCTFQVLGKSINKDEFVTAGGVVLKEVALKTMQSKLHQGLYFAGEVLNIDGITGGFNFQNAWTSGHHAGRAIASDI
ncbi:NAD(P)/FAD-dependent oxidoreductase [Rubritalea marina]|uniref:NAD(P)/FAD-dependent oxidoreductase n=1 Tax=Rubritalea marina TaxID=361055 RepID=UPI00035C1CA1|nr:NAD(P)/FAD-dependent oxidoreductase [Rubritalea marina]